MVKVFTIPFKEGSKQAVYHTAKGKFYLKRGATYKESDSGNIKRFIEDISKQPLLRPFVNKEIK